MNSIVTTRILTRGSGIAKKKLADGHQEPTLSGAWCPSSAGARRPARVPYVENDYDDELRYVVVLGEH